MTALGSASVHIRNPVSSLSVAQIRRSTRVTSTTHASQIMRDSTRWTSLPLASMAAKHALVQAARVLAAMVLHPIVDSGTPPLVLPETAFMGVVEAAEASTCTVDTDCFVTLEIGDVCVNSVGLLECGANGHCAVAPGAIQMSSGQAIVGNKALNHLYLVLDRANKRVGFAERSTEQCSVPCSSFLSVYSCQRAQCTWNTESSSCDGEQGIGSTSRGSTVSSGGSCFTSRIQHDDSFRDNFWHSYHEVREHFDDSDCRYYSGHCYCCYDESASDFGSVVTANGTRAVNVPVLHFPAHERSGTYLDVQIGTPPQTVSVILDTGSSTLAVGSATTQGSHQICPADRPLPGNMDHWSTENLNDENDVCVVGAYTPTASITMVSGAGSATCNTPIGRGRCGFAVAYGTGAYGIQGYLVNDELAMGGLNTTVSIGAITEMVGSWQQAPTNGIFGVAMSSLNCLHATMQDATSFRFLQFSNDVRAERHDFVPARHGPGGQVWGVPWCDRNTRIADVGRCGSVVVHRRHPLHAHHGKRGLLFCGLYRHWY